MAYPPRPFATNLDDEMMWLVGRIVRWWSMVEWTVDSSVRDLLNRPDTQNLDTSLVISFKHRLQLLKTLLAEVVKNPDDLAKLGRIIDGISRLQNYRDFVVHGMMINAAGRNTHVYMSRVRWSNPTKVRRTFLRKTKLFEIEERIFHANMELFMATAGCHAPGWTPSLDILPPRKPSP